MAATAVQMATSIRPRSAVPFSMQAKQRRRRESIAELHPDSPRDPGYRVPRILVDQIGIRPVDLAIVDGVETVRGGEDPGCREAWRE